jgi:chemotaxis protein methyltransferase CheR
MELSETSFLYHLIEDRTGLVLDNHRHDDVARVVRNLLPKAGLSGVHDLALALRDQPTASPLWQNLIQGLTIDETYFFRNQPHLDALRNHVFRSLIAERQQNGHKYLRIWSAGCASGEEPYTLAMLLRCLIPDIESWTITLLATDINKRYLERARQAIYRARSFRNETPAELRERWFTREGDAYRLLPVIRSMVHFATLNLVSDHYPSYESGTMNMDLIVCRNVTIYFDRETTRRVVERFHRALNSSGWLLVGHAEPQAGVYNAFTPRNFENAVLYQKSETPAALPEPAAPSQPVVIPDPIPTLPPTTPAPAVEQSSPEDAWHSAKAAADAEQWGEALAWLDLAEQRDSLQPAVHYLRGLIRAHYGDHEGAIWSLRQAVYCDPSFALAHYALGDLYKQQGSHKLAVRYWQQTQSVIAGLDPQHVLLHGDDLTVEALQGLLAHRLEVNHVNL